MLSSGSISQTHRGGPLFHPHQTECSVNRGTVVTYFSSSGLGSKAVPISNSAGSFSEHSHALQPNATAQSKSSDASAPRNTGSIPDTHPISSTSARHLKGHQNAESRPARPSHSDTELHSAASILCTSLPLSPPLPPHEFSTKQPLLLLPLNIPANDNRMHKQHSPLSTISEASFSLPLPPLRKFSVPGNFRLSHPASVFPLTVCTPVTSPSIPQSAPADYSAFPQGNNFQSFVVPSQPRSAASEIALLSERRASVDAVSLKRKLSATALLLPPTSSDKSHARSQATQYPSRSVSGARTDPKVLFRGMVHDEARRRRLSVEQYLSPKADDDEDDFEYDFPADEFQLDSNTFFEQLPRRKTFQQQPEEQTSSETTSLNRMPSPMHLSQSELFQFRKSIPKHFSFPTSPPVSAAPLSLSVTSTFEAPDAIILANQSSERGTAPSSSSLPRKHTAEAPVLPLHVDMSLYKETKNATMVSWMKGGPLTFGTDTKCLDMLTAEEILVCRTLRLYPEQYIHIKHSVIAGTYTRPPFKKKELRKWFPIDVNKLNKLYDWFLELSWIPRCESEWRQRNQSLIVE
ncbi:Transcriptional adapter ada2 [Chytriomyces hyalinus]|nr:Transcriptional adapter ada2 [Chytriomyces hyalinus]